MYTSITDSSPISLGPVLRALEDAWSAIRRHHSEIPPTVITIGQGSDPRSPNSLRRGHWAASRWERTEDGSEHHEVMIAGERLEDGGEGAFTTLLHEAAHGLAYARQIDETSRNGRYHNARYKALAEELLLDVDRDKVYGWTVTELSESARERYAVELAALDHAIQGYRYPERSKGKSSRKSRALLECGCGRKLYGAPGVVEVGPILCGVCGEPFAIQQDGDKDG